MADPLFSLALILLAAEAGGFVSGRLGLTRIGACDVGKRARTILRKRRARLALQHKRRKAGVRPRTEYLAQSLSRVRPWEAEGISRRTWERRQRARHAVSLVDTTRDIAAWAG